MISNVEEFMYKFMSSLYSTNTPIVFKGAMLLKVIQSNFGNPSGLVRDTRFRWRLGRRYTRYGLFNLSITKGSVECWIS